MFRPEVRAAHDTWYRCEYIILAGYNAKQFPEIPSFAACRIRESSALSRPNGAAIYVGNQNVCSCVLVHSSTLSLPWVLLVLMYCAAVPGDTILPATTTVVASLRGLYVLSVRALNHYTCVRTVCTSRLRTQQYA